MLSAFYSSGSSGGRSSIVLTTWSNWSQSSRGSGFSTAVSSEPCPPPPPVSSCFLLFSSLRPLPLYMCSHHKSLLCATDTHTWKLRKSRNRLDSLPLWFPCWDWNWSDGSFFSFSFFFFFFFLKSTSVISPAPSGSPCPWLTLKLIGIFFSTFAVLPLQQE